MFGLVSARAKTARNRSSLSGHSPLEHAVEGAGLLFCMFLSFFVGELHLMTDGDLRRRGDLYLYHPRGSRFTQKMLSHHKPHLPSERPLSFSFQGANICLLFIVSYFNSTAVCTHMSASEGTTVLTMFTPKGRSFVTDTNYCSPRTFGTVSIRCGKQHERLTRAHFVAEHEVAGRTPPRHGQLARTKEAHKHKNTTKGAAAVGSDPLIPLFHTETAKESTYRIPTTQLQGLRLLRFTTTGVWCLRTQAKIHAGRSYLLWNTDRNGGRRWRTLPPKGDKNICIDFYK